MLNLYPGFLGSKIHDSKWESEMDSFLNSTREHSVVELSSKINNSEIWFLRRAQKTNYCGLVSVSLGITQLVTAKKQLREQDGKTYYTAKLASLGEMAAGFAHEINNPLTIILGSATIIEKMIDEEPSFEAPVIFKGKEGQLSKVILNLISNSINAVKNEEMRCIEVRYNLSSDALDIFVSDSRGRSI